MASIKQINERKFKITVSNGYRPDGKKICKAKTITVPHEIHSRGIKQYVAHEAEVFERYVKNGYGEDANTSFRDFAEGWLRRQGRLAPSTQASYKRMLEVCCEYIGDIPLSKLRPISLENMLEAIRQREYRGKKIQEKTAQKYLTVVSAVLSDAKRNEIIQKNPARMIDLPMKEDSLQIIPSPEEERIILNAILKEAPVFRVYYILAIYTGCRRGELAALKWSDLEFTSGGAILTISRSRTVVPGKGIIEGSTKNGKARIVCLSNGMIDILSKFFAHQFTQAHKHNRDMSDYMFVNEYGIPYHPDTFTKRMRKLYDKHGLSKAFHLHTLRHYFVTSLLHQGIDKQTVAELAGHSDTGFLERTYCHPSLDKKQEAAAVMENILMPHS